MLKINGVDYSLCIYSCLHATFEVYYSDSLIIPQPIFEVEIIWLQILIQYINKF